MREVHKRFKKPCSALIAIIALTVLHSTVVGSQDATKTAPRAYQLRFENKWVRVIRVHYEPREKIPPHAHTQWPAAYVYLNDSGPVIFRHKDWEHPELTRPATKAGSFRLSPTTAVNEVHEVENTSDLPSDFLRVEFKTRATGRESLRGRFYREDNPAGGNFRKVHFENPQIRVTRLICAPHQRLNVAASSSEPALFIVLSSSRVRFGVTRDAGKQTTLEPGKEIWIAPGDKGLLENLGETPLELLQFDLRTTPVQPKKIRKKAA